MMSIQKDTFTVLTAHHALCDFSCHIPAGLPLSKIFNRYNNCIQYPELRKSKIENQCYLQLLDAPV